MLLISDFMARHDARTSSAEDIMRWLVQSSKPNLQSPSTNKCNSICFFLSHAGNRHSNASRYFQQSYVPEQPDTGRPLWGKAVNWLRSLLIRALVLKRSLEKDINFHTALLKPPFKCSPFTWTLPSHPIIEETGCLCPHSSQSSFSFCIFLRYTWWPTFRQEALKAKQKTFLPLLFSEEMATTESVSWKEVLWIQEQDIITCALAVKRNNDMRKP